MSKLAFITGASKGIGRATAIEVAKAGLDVFITARNKKELENLKKHINDIGQKCYFFPADLSNLSMVTELLDEISKLNRNISLLIHSAGTAKVGTVKNMNIADWQSTINLNLTIPFFITSKLLFSVMETGHIFFINSVAGRQSFPEWSAYSSSKFGLKALADSLRQEIVSQGIKVTSIFPASVDTPLQNDLPYDWDRTKMLKVSDVAKAIVFCYSQPASVLVKNLELENIAGTF
jgi:NADP-dependent 3-hydroxy acid dehydrogenase YdfG